MEGLSGEAASLTGHLHLSNLCWIYDNNHITIEGNTALAFLEDVAVRFLSYGWNVWRVGDANDLERLEGMIDPARPEVKVAVDVARTAGLRCIMITGDYRDTAAAIAEQIGMRSEGGEVVTGAEVDDMTGDELDGMVLHLNTCARSSPQHKMRIADSLKRRSHIVAMTGDGVNDAPALKRANIGVAMGITGAELTKIYLRARAKRIETALAAQMVLA